MANQGINESLQVLRAARQATNVISIHKVCELQVPDLNPNSWSCGLQMVMQPINEDAKQGGTEWAALSEPNGWTLAVATLTIDPHGQQRAMTWLVIKIGRKKKHSSDE